MTTVLRVKRRNDCEPLDALVIACKKRKTEAGAANEAFGESPLTAVVKFAATVTNQEDDVVEHVKKALTKEELKANYKQHIVDVARKARLKSKQESQDSRYKVVNCIRSIHTSKPENQDDSSMTVIDAEHSAVVEAAAAEEKEIGYVYDLYYTQTADNIHPDDALSIHPFEEELVFDRYKENGVRSEDECDSEDSNSESNWKNEYPDSDHSENSIDDEDMKAAVRNMKLDGEESDLSTDEDFVYAVNEDEVETFGFKYAKYKAKIQEELEDSDSSLSDYSGCRITEEIDSDEDETEKKEVED